MDEARRGGDIFFRLMLQSKHSTYKVQYDTQHAECSEVPPQAHPASALLPAWPVTVELQSVVNVLFGHVHMLLACFHCCAPRLFLRSQGLRNHDTLVLACSFTIAQTTKASTQWPAALHTLLWHHILSPLRAWQQ